MINALFSRNALFSSLNCVCVFRSMVFLVSVGNFATA